MGRSDDAEAAAECRGDPAEPASRALIVVDASVVVHLALRRALGRLEPHEPAAPTLVWSETTSALRQLAWRGDIEDRHAEEGLRALQALPLRLDPAGGLAEEAYALAVRLGWARTYDAEYLALAIRLDCPLLTIDARLARTAARFVAVAPPESV